MTRAAIYLRISQDATGEGLGVARQLEDCAALAEANGWEVAEVYQDNDISAVSGKPRPAYNKLTDDMVSGQIDAVVCWHADRLYRRMADLEHLVKIVRETGTQIATVKAGRIDLTSDAGQMLAEILASVASYEGRAKATRWKRSWQQGRESGRPAKTGTRLFGYTRDGEVIPDEADIARRMAKDVASGIGLLTIANWLQAEGITTTRGNVWRTGTIRQYLSQPRIAGYSTLKGEIVAEGTWEPIIDRDTWETIRALFTSRSRPRPPRVALLGGLIYCGQCGTRLITGSIGTTRAKGREGKRRTYRCSRRPGIDGCGSVSAYAEPIEEIVETYAKERLNDPRSWERVARLRAGGDVPALLAEINALEGRLVELEQQLDEPGVPVSAILRGMDRARERLGECQTKLAEQLAERISPDVILGGLDWPAGLAERRKLIDAALGEKRIYLDPVNREGPRRFQPERVRISHAETA